jgi:oxysterol-binding protein-related protein 9/10/11
MSGMDQITAKISGTTVRVAPGQLNQGIFIRLTGGHGEGERYQITHPVASVNGILRGSFYVTVGESTIITCEGGKPGSKLRTIIEYKEEVMCSYINPTLIPFLTVSSFFLFFKKKSWLGRAHYLVEGVIHTVFDSDTTKCSEWTKVKHVPQHRIVATFDGTWRGRIRWKRVGSGSYPTNNIGRGTTSSPSLSFTPSTSSLSHPRLSNSYSTSILSSKTSDTLEEDEDEWKELLDLSSLHVIPKVVRPLERQEPRESRKLWEKVTNNLLNKEYSEATKEKVEIEQRQRDEAAERKRKGLLYVSFSTPIFFFFLTETLTAFFFGNRFIPRYFVPHYDDGYAALTPEGFAAIEEEMKEDAAYCIEGVDPNVALAA